MGDKPQNDFKMRADLSHSWSRVVGKKASQPSLLLSLLTGPPSFSNAAHPLSNAAFPSFFVLAQLVVVVIVVVADIVCIQLLDYNGDIDVKSNTDYVVQGKY